MIKGFWELNRMEGKNPAHTGSFLTPYDQRDFSPDEVTARESAQNTTDAGHNIDGITQLVFQRLKARGKNKEKFLNLIQARELLEPRISIFEGKGGHKHFTESVKSFLKNDEIHALLIRDFNTCGLGGRWDRYEKYDHFARLVCAINLDDKADDDSSSGGSFGLGKTTFTRSSNIHTVIYHSVFKKSKETNHVNRRLMVAGVYPRHLCNGRRYGGFAYYGKKDEEKPKVAVPFENESAVEFWKELSDVFQIDLTRSSKSTGTDILIIMDSLELKNLKKAIEEYYFPALIKNDLAVTFIDEKGYKDSPSLSERKDLDQFIQLFKKAEGSKSIIKEETLRIGSFNKKDELDIGRYAFEAAEVDEAESTKNNCVAIMRGTGMVINYIKLGSDRYEPAVGVYIADQEIHKFLQVSENPAHSEWSEHSDRLIQKFLKKGKNLVSHVNRTIKRSFIQFQKDLRPDTSVPRSERGLLAKLLADALSGTKGNQGIDKPFHNPISLSMHKKSRSNDKSIWTLKIRDCEFTPEEPFDLTLMPSIYLAGDAKWVAIKHMNFIVRDKGGDILRNESAPALEYKFSKGMTLNFTIEIPNPGRHNYVVQCKCMVKNGTFYFK